jgi:hypothetical protein
LIRVISPPGDGDLHCVFIPGTRLLFFQESVEDTVIDSQEIGNRESQYSREFLLSLRDATNLDEHREFIDRVREVECNKSKN